MYRIDPMGPMRFRSNPKDFVQGIPLQVVTPIWESRNLV
jgi:hypothetical protein